MSNEGFLKFIRDEIEKDLVTVIQEETTDKVSVNTQSLTEEQKTQALTNLGVIAALEALITEYGGTVPTSVNTVSAQNEGTDPWADLS